MSDEPIHIRIGRQIAEEAAICATEAADAIREAAYPSRNKDVDWHLVAKRRLRAALALIGGMD